MRPSDSFWTVSKRGKTLRRKVGAFFTFRKGREYPELRKSPEYGRIYESTASPCTPDDKENALC